MVQLVFLSQQNIRKKILIFTAIVCGDGFAHKEARTLRHRVSTYSNASSRAVNDGCSCSNTFKLTKKLD